MSFQGKIKKERRQPNCRMKNKCLEYRCNGLPRTEYKRKNTANRSYQQKSKHSVTVPASQRE